MVNPVCEGHILLLSALLITAGAAKLAGTGRRGGPWAAERTVDRGGERAVDRSGDRGGNPAWEGAGRRGGDRRPFGGTALLALATPSRTATASFALVEIGLGVALLATSSVLLRAITIVVFATATWVLMELRSRRPGVGCGCFGPLSTAPACGRSLFRAALLTAAAASLIGVPVSGVEVLGDLSAAHCAGLTTELAVLMLVSPELDNAFRRLRRRAPCELRVRPLADTLQRLHASRTWRQHVPLLTSDEPTDVWREMCWRYLVYPGTFDGRPVDVVFAVYLDGIRPPLNAAIVEAESSDEPGTPDRAGAPKTPWSPDEAGSPDQAGLPAGR